MAEKITLVKNAMDYARSRGLPLLSDQVGQTCYRGMQGSTVEEWCLWMRSQRKKPEDDLEDDDDHHGYYTDE